MLTVNCASEKDMASKLLLMLIVSVILALFVIFDAVRAWGQCENPNYVSEVNLELRCSGKKTKKINQCGN